VFTLKRKRRQKTKAEKFIERKLIEKLKELSLFWSSEQHTSFCGGSTRRDNSRWTRKLIKFHRQCEFSRATTIGKAISLQISSFFLEIPERSIAKTINSTATRRMEQTSL
jgi:hypothetical protein